MSQTIKFAKAGGPEVLDYVEVAAINPAANEVRIKVKAIGLNRAESMWRLDDYIEPVARFPAVLGYEAAGTIDALGEGVIGFAVLYRGCFYLDDVRDGLWRVDRRR
jgi:NADPH:quinone reductase-like Zn-dependent oxidoreductase